MLRGLCASVMFMSVVACGSKGTPSSATPTTVTPVSSDKGAATFSASGRVVAHRTQAPIPGATVSIVNGPDAGLSTTTEGAGMFTFKGLQQSSSIVNVTADGYFDTRAPLTANQTMTVFLIELGPAIVLTGQVTDAATSSPIPGATVDINGRYLTTTDSSGNYSLTGHLDQGGGTDVTHVYLIGYELFARYIRGMSSQSFRLYRIERITGGGSWLVTVRPDDSLCDNDLQDPQGANPGSGNVCRTVRVVAPSDGVLNLEAVSTGGVHPPLEVEVLGPPRTERIANPTSVRIAAGGEVEVSVEIPEGSTESQTFRLTTSMAGQ